MRLVLTAQQTAASDNFGIDPLFDFALFHQFKECRFIDVPVALVLLVGIEDVRGGCEQRQVDVVDVGDFLKEVLEVIAL